VKRVCFFRERFMKITIKASNLKLTSGIRNYIKEKIGGLEKFIQGVKAEDRFLEGKNFSIEAWVEIERTARHRKGQVFRAECQIKLPRGGARAESTKEDLYLAIDDVKDELQRELKQYTEVKLSKSRRAARRFKRLISFSPLSKLRRKK